MSCKAMIGCLGCLALLGGGGFLAWFFGPWRQDDDNDSNDNDNKNGGLSSAAYLCEGCCNGLPSNCGLAMNEILIPTVHNAHSSYDRQFLAANNNLELEEALLAGFRGFMLDSCWCSDEDDGEAYLGFCHVYCEAGVRDPHELLSNINLFLQQYPTEVITIEFQINDNTLPQLHTALQKSGLLSHVYRPPPPTASNQYPTLQTLIDANTRLLLFAHGGNMKSCNTNLANSNDPTNIVAKVCNDGISYKFDYIHQTPWNDASTCNSMSNAATVARMPYFLLNHFQNNDLDLPSVFKARTINSYESIQARFQKCQQNNNLWEPNFLAVDFWEQGQVMQFVMDVNEQRGQQTTSIAVGSVDDVGSIALDQDTASSIAKSATKPDNND